MTAKLEKLWNRHKQSQQEMQDLQQEFQTEREDMLDTIRDLRKEVKFLGRWKGALLLVDDDDDDDDDDVESKSIHVFVGCFFSCLFFPTVFQPERVRY